MRYLKRVCAGIALTLVFALPTFAGQMPCDGITAPPPDPESRAATIESEVIGVAMTLLQDVLGVL